MFPISDSNFNSLYTQALKALNFGSLEVAERSFSDLLNMAPNHAPSHYQLSVIATKKMNYRTALSSLKKAVKHDSKNFQYWKAAVVAANAAGQRKEVMGLVKQARRQKFSAEAIAELVNSANHNLKKSKTSLGGTPKEHVDHVLNQFRSGDFEGAKFRCLELVNAFPDVAFTRNLYGAILIQVEDYPEALQQLKKAVQLDPKYAEAHNNLGMAFRFFDETSLAIGAFETAVELAPKMSSAVVNLGVTLADAGDSARAVKLLTPHARGKSPLPEVLAAIGNSCCRLGKWDDALKYALKLTRLVPGSEAADGIIVEAHLGQGRLPDALDYLDTRYSGKKLSVPICLKYAQLYSDLGDFEKSRHYYSLGIASSPSDGLLFRNLGALGKWRKDDPVIETMKTEFEKCRSLPDREEDLMEFGFALGKAMEDIKEFESVFNYLNVANEVSAHGRGYDPAKASKDFSLVKRQVNSTYLKILDGRGFDDDTSIFIVGMPRSGTTLTEQVITSHSKVSGAGEVGAAHNLAKAAVRDPIKGISSAEALLGDKLKEIGKSSTRQLKNKCPGSRYITDKMMSSFLYLGIIQAALPNAKIVHVYRNPIDNCLSLYKNNLFNSSYAYSANQKYLGHYYSEYVALMDHWRSLFGEKIVEVNYDQLVASPETQIPALISSLGLEWEDACLDPTANKRQVQTLSVYQARQPINTASVKGWKKYESDLGELIASLQAGGVELDLS